MPDRETEACGAVAEIHQQVADLLDGPWPVRVRGDPGDMSGAGADLRDEQAGQAVEGTAQSRWKKSVASIVAACVCRNCRQVVSVRRCGGGGIFSAVRTRRMVDALTRWPGLSSSPRFRWYPQPSVSVASRWNSAAISALTGGRPVRFGQVHVRAARRRCQRRTVQGVTSRCIRSRGGKSRISAARAARHHCSSLLTQTSGTHRLPGSVAFVMTTLAARVGRVVERLTA
jgi:hypothetical protein